MKWLWRTLKRLFYLLRLSVWLVGLLVVGGYAYLHFVGAPQFVRDYLTRELARHGIAAAFERIYIELPAHLVARNVTLGDMRTADRPLIRVQRVGIGLGFTKL